MRLNDWNEIEVKRAESTWGSEFKQYSLDMFNFLIRNRANSYLDLGCGFGRFLEYLLTKVNEPDYIGYDSSPAMIARIQERFPIYSARTFIHSVTEPITHKQKCVLCSAVLVHLNEQDQMSVLSVIKVINPKFIAFDINCYNGQTTPFIEQISRTKTTENDFRMTWQSPTIMRDRVFNLFQNTHNIEIRNYDLNKNRSKVVFLLRAKATLPGLKSANKVVRNRQRMRLKKQK